MNRIVIIGGGASGLCAALSARNNGAEVVVLEHNDRLGRKLQATGNGKCNLSNAFLSDACYRGGDHGFVDSVFQNMSPEQVREFFTGNGLMLKEKNGYFYPYSEQAASVVQFFASRLMNDKNVTIRLQAEVTEVTAGVGSNPKDGAGSKERKPGFTVFYNDRATGEKEQIACDRVIVAAGGLAGENLGAGPLGYEIAKSFGHRVTKLFPALVQLECKGAGTKAVSGVRADVRLRLRVQDGNRKPSAEGNHKPQSKASGLFTEYKESGEVLFTDYGISGIAVMQVSRFASEALLSGGKAELLLDFMPGLKEQDLFGQMKTLLNAQWKQIPLEDALAGLLPKKLLYKLICEAGLDATKRAGDIRDESIRKLVAMIKEYRLTVTGTKDFPSAQVTAGGIELKEINPVTLESKRIKGLYFTGELLDVDGMCGGYNLQFAFATGLLAGRAAAKQRK